MAQKGTVQEILFSKAGKPQVKIDGTKYWIKTHEGLRLGATIEFDAAEFGTTDSGHALWGINKWGLVNGSADSPAPRAAAPSPAANGWLTEGRRLTLSNWVAACITGGLVKAPNDLPLIALRCKDALLAIESDKPAGPTPVEAPKPDFDDAIGF